jgi:hypothetical protein
VYSTPSTRKFDDYSKAKLADWFTILRLAHEWGFQNIKDLAPRYIKTFEHEIPNVVERIVAYEKYAPPAEMLLPLYMELVGRDEFPTDAECALLGDSKALKIHRARETLIRAQKKAGTRPEAAQIKALVAKTLELTDTPTVNGAGMCFSILFPALVDRLIVGNTAASSGAKAQEASTDGRPAV